MQPAWRAVREYIMHRVQTGPKQAVRPLVTADADGSQHGGTAPIVEVPPPGMPSVAVLAFTNTSGEVDQDYFSDGIAEDIATQLSYSTALFVSACDVSIRYKGQAADVKQIGRELGVQYVLQGSARRDGALARISAELVEADTGKRLWTAAFERVAHDLFEVQDEIAVAVALAMEPRISPVERQRISSKPVVSYRVLQEPMQPDQVSGEIARLPG